MKKLIDFLQREVSSDADNLNNSINTTLEIIVLLAHKYLFNLTCSTLLIPIGI